MTPLETVLCEPATRAAPALLGCLVRHGGVVVRLTEVEAYEGPDDPASHAFGGPTRRTAIMFGPAGRLYVYFSYGMHWCANVVCRPDGSASAVLLRAGEVVSGLPTARERRGARVPDKRLATGPACLTQALGIAAAAAGADLLGSGPVHLLPADTGTGRVRSGPRIGVSRAADRPWRFWIDGEPSVSAYRRSPRAVDGW
ncbi:DNA-3-methyladenine glycosylase [soil metagenome]